MWVNKLSVWYTWRHCRCWVTEKTMGASVLTCSRCCCCVLPFSLVEVGLRWSENKITNKTKAPKQDKQDSDSHIKHGQSYKYWGQSLFFFFLVLPLTTLSTSSVFHSLAADIPKMATPGTQYWVWAQRPFPPAVQTFCLGGTSNQMKDGLQKGRGQQANSDFFLTVDELTAAPRPPIALLE